MMLTTRRAIAPAALALLLTAPDVTAQCPHQELTAIDGAASEQYGHDIALSGNRLIVGVPRQDRGERDTGAAYIYETSDGGATWTLNQKLTTSDSNLLHLYGWSVDIDGDVAVVGAWLDDEFVTNGGAAYVYRFNGSSWAFEQKLVSSDLAEGDDFGWAVAIEGDVIVVGADQQDGAALDGGAAYVFRYDGFGWLQEQKLTAADAHPQDDFGVNVAISGDTIAVGAANSGNSTPIGSPNDRVDDGTGAVYVFRFDGVTWMQEARLVGDDAAPEDFLGFDLVLEGDRLATSAFGHDGLGPDTGAAYVFHRSGTAWTQVAKLQPDAGQPEAFFGNPALSGDTMIVGSSNEDSTGAGNFDGKGAAYTYRFQNSTWTRVSRVTADDATLGDSFGFQVALEADIAASTSIFDDELAPDAGSVYLFSIDPACACPCDRDGTPGVGIFDLLAYLDLWFARDPDANLDADPTVSIFDLLEFLNCWFVAGTGGLCP